MEGDINKEKKKKKGEYLQVFQQEQEPLQEITALGVGGKMIYDKFNKKPSEEITEKNLMRIQIKLFKN